MEYNRDKDGRFAPKGTGDKTGFEKGFRKAMPKGVPVKTVSLPFGDKPTLDEVLPDLYGIMNADYADEKQEAEASVQTYNALMEAAGRAEPEEAEALKKEAEGWKRHADELNGLDPELERLLSENLKYVIADQTPENIEKGNAAGEALAAYVLEGASDADIDEYDTVSGTYKDPEELAELSRKIVAKRKNKPAKKDALPF